MQDDNLLPNDGSYFMPREPADQVADRKREQGKTLEAKSLINELIDHFDQRIEFRDTLAAIKPDLAKDPALHQKVCEVNDMLKLVLIEERDMLTELLDIHVKK